jgi:hypothetical protein
VVLRSIARRVAEAKESAEGEPVPADALAALDAAVRDVAQQAGVTATGDRDALAATAAERIEHIPASQWTDESLNRLRDAARSIGAALRRLEAAGEGGFGAR